MKKLILFFAAVLLVAGCSDESKAKASAKKYLEPNTNDGKIEIVDVTFSDYTYEHSTEKFLLEAELEAVTRIAEEQLDKYDLYKGIDDEEAKASLDFAQIYIQKADSIEAAIKAINAPTYQIKKGSVKARGNNALGMKVLDEIGGLYWSNDLKKCSKNPAEVIPVK
ncbi:MAG: membrane lipoprotein lipid attachment site-containing protein [Bacteroidales bacterium]|nr:membrane lipoprotein lipid attachment site-containing protein [Bacteroidales bacterium]